MHDAGEFAAGLPELVLSLASESRVRGSAVHDERSPDRPPSELRTDLVRVVDRLEGLRDGPEVERAGLDWKHGDIGGDRGALRDIAEPRWAVEEHVVVTADDLPETRERDRLVGPHDGEALERGTVLARGAPMERTRLPAHVDDECSTALEMRRGGQVTGATHRSAGLATRRKAWA